MVSKNKGEKSEKGKKSAAFLLRISPELKAALVDLAKRQHRSLNQQIEFMLSEGLKTAAEHIRGAK